VSVSNQRSEKVRIQTGRSDSAREEKEDVGAEAPENTGLQSDKLEDEGEALARIVEKSLCSVDAEVVFFYISLCLPTVFNPQPSAYHILSLHAGQNRYYVYSLGLLVTE
jgi:hypothetical protein